MSFKETNRLILLALKEISALTEEELDDEKSTAICKFVEFYLKKEGFLDNTKKMHEE